jgi:hypothetical protein
MDQVATGRDAKTAAADPLFARYRAERALVVVAAPLAAVMAKLVGSARVSADDLTPVARALVRAFVARSGSPSMANLAPAAVSALLDHLGSVALVDAGPDVGTGRVRELMALSDALHAEA